MAWSDAARKAALEARRRNSRSKLRTAHESIAMQRAGYSKSASSVIPRLAQALSLSLGKNPTAKQLRAAGYKREEPRRGSRGSTWFHDSLYDRWGAPRGKGTEVKLGRWTLLQARKKRR